MFTFNYCLQSAPELGRVSSRSHSSAEASGDVKYKTGSRSETVDSQTYHQPEREQQKQQQQQLHQHQWENQQSIQSKETACKIAVFSC